MNKLHLNVVFCIVQSEIPIGYAVMLERFSVTQLVLECSDAGCSFSIHIL
jgi:hypothetical protein